MLCPSLYLCFCIYFWGVKERKQKGWCSCLRVVMLESTVTSLLPRDSLVMGLLARNTPRFVVGPTNELSTRHRPQGIKIIIRMKVGTTWKKGQISHGIEKGCEMTAGWVQCRWSSCRYRYRCSRSLMSDAGWWTLMCPIHSLLTFIFY